MRFSKLSEYLERLEKTSSRNEITVIVAEILKEVSAVGVDKVCYLLGGRVLPQYTGVEFNFAEKMMMRTIALAYDEELDEVNKRFKQVGDLGDLAEAIARAKNKVQSAKLEIEEVYERLEKLADESGQGSQEKKVQCMVDLLKDIDPLSCRYVARIPVGRMRLGFSDITILDALSLMEAGDKSLRKRIEAAYNVTADVGRIAKQVKERGVDSLDKVEATAGVPIRPALAERLPSAVKIIEKLGPRVAVEGKYDGFRIQLHVWYENGEKQVRLFSRNLENVTLMFPEIMIAAKKLPLKSGVFDGEAIAYNPKTGKLLPFQDTIQRKRKHGIEQFAKDMPLKLFVYDVLVYDEKSMLGAPFSQRRPLLEKILKHEVDGIQLVPQVITDDPEVLRKEFEKYIRDGLEGAMCKKLDVAYQAGGRGYHWVKYKKATEGELLDTVDCILMGAYRGRGRRAGFGVGGFLIGIPNGDSKIYSLTKLGTGVTDEQFKSMSKMVDRIAAEEQPKEYVVDKMLIPDVWVKPKVVLEILADEITISTNHTAGRESGKGKEGKVSKESKKGFSLRFPRLVKIREDKNPDQATSVKELKKLYEMQKVLLGNVG